MSEKLVKANSVSFPISDKVLYANEGSRIIWSWIHEAYGGWVYDDANFLDFPEATTDMNANQVDYSLPIEESALMGVSVKTVGGVWQQLTPITLEEIQDTGFAEPEFLKTPAQPMYYRPLAKSFKIYPASNYTQSASIKIHERRDISQFSTTDTTKKPGFDVSYHEALPTYMAMKHAQINSLPQAGGVLRGGFKTGLVATWSDYEQRIKKDYQRRFAELYPPRITVRDITRDNQ